jgi:hypothetical protein
VLAADRCCEQPWLRVAHFLSSSRKRTERARATRRRRGARGGRPPRCDDLAASSAVHSGTRAMPCRWRVEHVPERRRGAGRPRPTPQNFSTLTSGTSTSVAADELRDGRHDGSWTRGRRIRPRPQTAATTRDRAVVAPGVVHLRQIKHRHRRHGLRGWLSGLCRRVPWIPSTATAGGRTYRRLGGDDAVAQIKTVVKQSSSSASSAPRSDRRVGRPVRR